MMCRISFELHGWEEVRVWMKTRLAMVEDAQIHGSSLYYSTSAYIKNFYKMYRLSLYHYIYILLPSKIHVIAHVIYCSKIVF